MSLALMKNGFLYGDILEMTPDEMGDWLDSAAELNRMINEQTGD